jgi:hypothetical protein
MKWTRKYWIGVCGLIQTQYSCVDPWKLTGTLLWVAQFLEPCSTVDTLLCVSDNAFACWRRCTGSHPHVTGFIALLVTATQPNSGLSILTKLRQSHACVDWMHCCHCYMTKHGFSLLTNLHWLVTPVWLDLHYWSLLHYWTMAWACPARCKSQWWVPWVLRNDAVYCCWWFCHSPCATAKLHWGPLAC